MRPTVGMLLFGCLVGLVLGLALYTFVYAKGYSYLTNNAAACANCHVMQDYYAAWMKSSHHAVAVCNDCHTPHNFILKYANKAANGFLHSFAFTTGWFPDNIQIKRYNRRITESACKTCHAELTQSILGVHGGNELSCTRCHSNVGHSAVPFSSTLESRN